MLLSRRNTLLVLALGGAAATLAVLGNFYATANSRSAANYPTRAPSTVSIDSEVPLSGVVLELPKQLSLPPSYTVVMQSISANTIWLVELQRFLYKLPEKLVVMVSVTSSFLEILLNWLAIYHRNVARPVEDVLIVAMDEESYAMAKVMNLSTILVTAREVVVSQEYLKTNHSYIWIIRSIVLRLMNYWGFDVVMFDVDALLLKDPFPLLQQYSDSDIVATKGSYPFELGREWGATMCMGAVLIKSTPGTEIFWQATGLVDDEKQDDQVLFNKALYLLAITWTPSDCNNITPCAGTVSGHSPRGLHVTLLSHDIACRSCDLFKRDTYYIWHPRSSRKNISKIKKEKKAGLWLLRKNWREVWEAKNTKLIDLIFEI